MINRAKCVLCQSTIESHLPDEIVYCKCGEIAVCDGPAMRMMPLGSKNFVRVDDMGNEIVVQYRAHEEEPSEEQQEKDDNKNISIHEALEALEESIKYNDNLPQHVQYSFVTTYELNAYVRSILNILRRLRD